MDKAQRELMAQMSTGGGFNAAIAARVNDFNKKKEELQSELEAATRASSSKSSSTPASRNGNGATT